MAEAMTTATEQSVRPSAVTAQPQDAEAEIYSCANRLHSYSRFGQQSHRGFERDLHR